MKKLPWAFKSGRSDIKLKCYETIASKELHVYVNFSMPF